MSEAIDTLSSDQLSVDSEIESIRSKIVDIHSQLDELATVSADPLNGDQIVDLLERVNVLEFQRDELLFRHAGLLVVKSSLLETEPDAFNLQLQALLGSVVVDSSPLEILADLVLTDTALEADQDQLIIDVPPVDTLPEVNPVPIAKSVNIVAKPPKSQPVKKRSTLSQNLVPLVAATSAKAVKPGPKPKFPPVTTRMTETERHARYSVRKQFTESLDTVVDHPIIMKNRVNPNVDQGLLNFLCGRRDSPPNNVSPRSRGVTIRAFQDLPSDQKPKDALQRIIDCQI
jgi:hypothetical protein